MGPWELISDIRLQVPLCNMGCLSISHSEILLFGGFDSSAKEVKMGRVLMCLDGSHTYLEQPVDLTITDSFSSSSQVMESP